jgi:UrcA family protein
MNSLKHKSNMKLIVTLGATLWLGTMATSALADPPAVPPLVAKSTTVRFADLNLQSPEGARALYARIRTAAAELCGEQFSLWDGNRLREWKTCYRATIDRAVVQLNRPALTAMHRDSTPGRTAAPIGQQALNVENGDGAAHLNRSE